MSAWPTPEEMEDIFLRPVDEDEAKQWADFIKRLEQS